MQNKSFENADKMLTKSLLPSLLCIILCAVILCGTTFAWLSSSVSNNSTSLIGGNFSVDVTITDENSLPIALNNNSAHLSEGTYQVQVAKLGTANGYALLTLNGDTYLMEDFPMTFTIVVGSNMTEGVSVGFLSSWGNKPTSYETISPNQVINCN